MESQTAYLVAGFTAVWIAGGVSVAWTLVWTRLKGNEGR